MYREVSVNSGPVRFVQDLTVGSHAFLLDEPSDAGGEDAGPEPHELLLAALGACASITVQMYADRKQWPVEAVQVELSYVPLPPETSANTKNTTVGGIEMEISFSGNLSDAQRARLLEIAERCPVHRILTSPVKIYTKLLVPTSGSS